MSAPRRDFWTGVVDWAALVSTASCLIHVALDTDSAVRAGLALALVMFLPGWAVLRLAGARLTLFTVVGAAVISISTTMLLSLVLVTRTDWAWRGGALGLAALSFFGLMSVVARDDLERVGTTS